MSFVFVGRVLFAVGIGIAGLLMFTAYSNAREQNQSNTYHYSQRSRPGSNPEYRHTPAWEDDPYDNPSRRRRRSKSPSPDRSVTNDTDKSSSLQASCPICIEPFEKLKRKGIMLSSTSCGHVFCEDCLKSALQASSSCPTCRERVALQNCRKIFL